MQQEFGERRRETRHGPKTASEHFSSENSSTAKQPSRSMTLTNCPKRQTRVVVASSERGKNAGARSPRAAIVQCGGGWRRQENVSRGGDEDRRQVALARQQPRAATFDGQRLAMFVSVDTQMCACKEVAARKVESRRRAAVVTATEIHWPSAVVNSGQ
eukprot:1430749-Pleurochrysis_carterae.AAC.1